MGFEDLHDHGKDSIDVWHARLARFVRVGGFWLDVAWSVFVAIAAVLLGAVAGAAVSANFWPSGFWVATISGALFFGLAGWKLAKRTFLGDRVESSQETGAQYEGLFAPHLPEIQGKFDRARKREFALVVAVIASGVFLAFLAKAKLMLSTGLW